MVTNTKSFLSLIMGAAALSACSGETTVDAAEPVEIGEPEVTEDVVEPRVEVRKQEIEAEDTDEEGEVRPAGSQRRDGRPPRR